MRSLSERISESFKLKLTESDIQLSSIQKVLRLFGYIQSTKQTYVCCLSKNPRADVHKFYIGCNPHIMCIITDECKNVIDAALWLVNENTWNLCTRFILLNKTINDIDEMLMNQSQTSKLIMRYKPI